MVKARQIRVSSPNITYTDDFIDSIYDYQTTSVSERDNQLLIKPKTTRFYFRTDRNVPRLGVMLVGWGGNNGTTVTAAVLANKLNLQWRTKEGSHSPDYFGSLTQSGTTHLGRSQAGDVYIPIRELLPMVNPNDIVIDGWDISSLNLADSMERAKVIDYDLQRKLRPYMEKLKPKASIYYPEFIAANQADRADNLIPGTKQEQLERIRNDIKSFKKKENLEKVIIIWTANTERFCDIKLGLNDTEDNLLRSIKTNAGEVSPSTVFAVASILEGCAYINGSPQNTFVPGVVELATRLNVFIGGDDFKSGQTKLKSVLVDFLIGAGLKPVSIVSYNHLGNNDGKNLSAPAQFKSKEISKSSVIDDMVSSNSVLYKKGETPDHTVVIKYVPYVGDSKRAIDEYTSEILLGGKNTIVIHNTCEDSLLAAPIIIDLIVLTELCQRITFKNSQYSDKYQTFHPILSILSYLCKAPLVQKGTPVVNSFFRQRLCIENILRACIALPPINHMALEDKISRAGATEDDAILAEQGAILSTRLSSEDGTIQNGSGDINGILNGHAKKEVNGFINLGVQSN